MNIELVKENLDRSAEYMFECTDEEKKELKKLLGVKRLTNKVIEKFVSNALNSYIQNKK